MKRKILSLILCFSLVLSAFSLQIAYASDNTFIYKIENGAARDIRVSTLAALAHILECPMDKLCEYTPEKSQSDVLDGPIY